MTISRNINIVITAVLVSIWGLAHITPLLHDFEKNSPLLALTGACFVGTLGAILPGDFFITSTKKKLAAVRW